MGKIAAAVNPIVMKFMKIQKELEREAFPTLHGHSLLSTYVNDLNEKPEQTNFCSRKLFLAAQLDSLSGVVSGTVQTPAPEKAVKKKRIY